MSIPRLTWTQCVPDLTVFHNSPLQSCNTLALEARAAAMARVADEAQLQAALAWAAARRLPVIPLGEGSNVIFAGDLDALVLRVETRGIEVLADSRDATVLRVAAGENWHQLVRQTLRQGCYGLENLALIPGTVGAAPIQNIGAYGVELQSCLQYVHARTLSDGQDLALSRAECEFGYRDSVFKRELRDRVMITAVELQLSREPRVHAEYPALADALAHHRGSRLNPQAVFDAVVNIRRNKLPDPTVEPNAGSFFKNPLVSAELAQELVNKFPALPSYPQADGQVKLAAAWMIEHCGWKGYREDDIGVHPDHALVLVNYGNKSGERLLSLASEIAATVADTFGLQLVIEPRVYG